MAVTFRRGDTCLAYHGLCIYEAKVLDVRVSGNEPSYRLHWRGWAKKWDEWVATDRMMVKSPDTVALMERVTAEVRARERARTSTAARAAGAAKAGGKSSSKARSASASKSGKQAAAKATTPRSAAAEATGGPLPVTIRLPFVLRKHLVDDWEFIVQRACLVRLPKRPLGGEPPRLPSCEPSAKRARAAEAASFAATELPSGGVHPSYPLQASLAPALTVSDILDALLAEKTAQDRSQARGWVEVVEALKLYFDRSLALFLLYRYERAQYQYYLDHRPAEDTRAPCQVYGAEHLLRLFVKLPSLLAHARMSPSETAEISARLAAVVDFLHRHRESLFTYDYVRGSEDYADRRDAVAAGTAAPWDS